MRGKSTDTRVTGIPMGRTDQQPGAKIEKFFKNRTSSIDIHKTPLALSLGRADSFLLRFCAVSSSNSPRPTLAGVGWGGGPKRSGKYPIYGRTYEKVRSSAILRLSVPLLQIAENRVRVKLPFLLSLPSSGETRKTKAMHRTAVLIRQNQKKMHLLRNTQTQFTHGFQRATQFTNTHATFFAHLGVGGKYAKKIGTGSEGCAVNSVAHISNSEPSN